MYRYEQHCPVARAAEVLTEPWTLLVLRELLRGAERRADIAKGVPRMSASLLTARLRTLVANGLVVEVVHHPRDKRYRLTEAGRGLRPVVDQLGRWGQRWLTPPGLRDLDTDVLLHDICGQMTQDRLPEQPLTVAVAVADALDSGRWWLALSPSGATVHRGAPPRGADVRLACTLSGLAGIWLGRQSWLRAVRDGSVVFTGQPDTVRAVLACVGVSRYATRETA
ncbi:winged helix-turn-helix transcriptional regulator [Actinophytocola sp. NPDC049390]|uniref:winged helix-turn-helix transcriptional regulator n=1 Tax=Actinophytocola sp. NPDC049390 TaxID=3363894 RepID=UPI00379BDA51